MTSEEWFTKIVNAIYHTEGGDRTNHPYGILGFGKLSKPEARKIAQNTVRNNYKRWMQTDTQDDYLTFLQKRYAPLKVANDPTGLNKNWLGNLKHFIQNPKPA